MKNMELYNKIKKEVQEELGDMFDCPIDQYETSGEAEIKRRMQAIDPNDNTVSELIYERECAIRKQQYELFENLDEEIDDGDYGLQLYKGMNKERKFMGYDDMTGEPKFRR